MGVNRQQGYVLVTTIWMVAILTILASMFHGYVEAQVGRAVALQERTKQESEILSTEATLLYMMATRRTTQAGLIAEADRQTVTLNAAGGIDISALGGEIRLDGTPYRGIGDTLFSIQDQAGMLSANGPNNYTALRRMLYQRVGLQRSNDLIATLQDYIDENPVRRIDGAEASVYRAARMSPPTNWYLLSPPELYEVYGWREFLESEDGEIWRNVFAASQFLGLNINTATSEALQLGLGLSEEQAGKIIAARQSFPLRNPASLNEIVDSFETWEDLVLRTYVSEYMELRFWCEACNSSIVRGVRMTANGFRGPWLTEYRYRVQNEVERDDREAVALAPGTLLTESLPADS